MDFGFSNSHVSLKKRLCVFLAIVIAFSCFQISAPALAAYASSLVTSGNVTNGNVTGGNVSGGNVTGGNVTGGNVTGGNVTGGNVTGGNVTDDGNLRLESCNGVFLALNKAGTEYYVYKAGPKTHIEIPSSYNGKPVTGIGESAFAYSSVVSVTIPEGIKYIGARAFYECRSLHFITIPDSVESIGDYAFYIFDRVSNDDGVRVVSLGNGLKYIGSYVFRFNVIESIDIPASVKTISDTAFSECYIKCINVSEDNRYYSSVDGILFNKDQTELIKYPEDKEGLYYKIPDRVTHINRYALAGHYFNTLVFGTGIKSLPSMYFHAYSIVIPIEVEDICGAFINYCGIGGYTLPEIYYEGTLSQWDVTIGIDGWDEWNESYKWYYMDYYVLLYDKLHCSVDVDNWKEHWEEIAVDPPSCTESGYHICTCPCGYEKSESLSATGHNWEWVIETEPTCTGYGSGYRKCTDCDKEELDENIEPLGHEYPEQWLTCEPTCDTRGYDYKTCLVCNYTLKSNWTSYLGHDYSTEWTINPSTCTEYGSKYHKCTKCDSYIDFSYISPTGHNYVEQDVVNTHPHTITCVCSGCDDVITENPIVSDCVECNFSITPSSTGYKLISYIGSENSVIIPATYNGVAVSVIGNSCFKDSNYVTSIDIEYGVTTIGSIAFMNCRNLDKVTIPASVTSIGARAFYGFTGTIYCTGNSYAHQYAITNNIPYVLVDDTPIKETGNTIIDFDNFIIRTSVQSASDIADILGLSDTAEVIATASYVYGDIEVFGTGTIVTVFDGDAYIGDFVLVVEGDVNGDAVCDALDAVQVSRAATNKRNSLDEAYRLAADVNGDDIIDANDYRAILSKIVSKKV